MSQDQFGAGGAPHGPPHGGAPQQQPGPPSAMQSSAVQSGGVHKVDVGSLDDSTAHLEAIKARVKLFWGVMNGPIFKTFALLAGLGFVTTLGVQLILLVLNVAELDLSILRTLLSVVGGLVGAVVSIVIPVLQIAFFRIAHDQVIGLRDAPPATIKEALQDVKPVLIPVVIAALIAGAAVGIGTMFCLVPGVLAFIAFYPARYIAATRPDLSVGEAVESSIEVGKKYWAALLGLFFTVFFIALFTQGGVAVVAAIGGAIDAAAASNFGAVASSLALATTGIVTAFVQLCGTLALVVAVFCLEGGVMSVLTERYFGDRQL